ncbi:hypothetical protein AKJ65_04425 [candidate division MSBL1 archaeon SCGC-AAA259E19]|uniref:Uncharacterized protein n=1 Tax=candidate division MSBL1 archaeon SCGC-AAA259E19 TaxID=1698264 RepID=A0A133UJP5_9EURY|nr:hypothetical protein AKJ65_04425 [candidate division MSBL1 archaeon SCGC-AAA259E19]
MYLWSSDPGRITLDIFPSNPIESVFNARNSCGRNPPSKRVGIRALSLGGLAENADPHKTLKKLRGSMSFEEKGEILSEIDEKRKERRI